MVWFDFESKSNITIDFMNEAGFVSRTTKIIFARLQNDVQCCLKDKLKRGL